MLDQKELQEFIELVKDEAKNIEGPSEDALKVLYYLGYQFYQQGKYKEAKNFFRYLTHYQPFERKYWKGLASSCQMLQEYEQAIEFYSMAALQEPTDPHVHLHAFDCFFALGKMQEAMTALTSAEETAQLDKKYESLLPQLALLRKTWSEKQ